MRIGFYGLGRMGHNIVLHLLDEKHERHEKRSRHSVVAYNRHSDKTRKIARRGAVPSYSVEEFVKKLPRPRKIWLMVPAGRPVDAVIRQLLPHMNRGDIIIDGGNSFYRDSVRRHAALKKRGISFLDCGTSGGLEGARHGACLTIGGDRTVFKRCEALFRAVAAKGGYAYVGPAGAGHFVKMVHNGMEYAMLQATGEGFELLRRGPYRNLDLRKMADVWSHGSVIRSWLMELAADAFRKDPKLSRIRGRVGGGQTGAWSVKTAKKYRVAVPSVELALRIRKKSRKKDTFSSRVIAALRQEFGGHPVTVTKPKHKKK